jgi:hypothetical protein
MLQYPKHKSVTLPSVEGGFGTLNILKDPARSIYTRYKSKVGDNNRILEWKDDSGDRICEAIKPYARGVNPMVSVQYRSHGGSIGGNVRDRSGTVGTDQAPLSTIGQGKLPYRVARDSAFRPPVIAPQQLLPLSRQPRNTTNCTTNAGSNLTIVDKILKCPSNLKQVLADTMKVCVAPKASLTIGKPTPDVWTADQAVRDSLIKAMARTNQHSDYRLGILKNQVPKQPIQDINYSAMTVNPVKVRDCPGLDGKKGLVPMPLKSVIKSAVNSGLSGQGNTLMHNVQTERPCQRPRAQAVTNKHVGGLNKMIQNRNVVLPRKLQAGSFENSGHKSNYGYNPIVKHRGIASTSVVNNALSLQNSR